MYGKNFESVSRTLGVFGTGSYGCDPLDELILHTGITSASLMKGGSPWYVPKRDEALNIHKPTSVKDWTNSLWDPTKGNMPLGVVDSILL